MKAAEKVEMEMAGIRLQHWLFKSEIGVLHATRELVGDMEVVIPGGALVIISGETDQHYQGRFFSETDRFNRWFPKRYTRRAMEFELWPFERSSPHELILEAA